MKVSKGKRLRGILKLATKFFKMQWYSTKFTNAKLGQNQTMSENQTVQI